MKCFIYNLQLINQFQSVLCERHTYTYIIYYTVYYYLWLYYYYNYIIIVYFVVVPSAHQLRCDDDASFDDRHCLTKSLVLSILFFVKTSWLCFAAPMLTRIPALDVRGILGFSDINFNFGGILLQFVVCEVCISRQTISEWHWSLI